VNPVRFAPRSSENQGKFLFLLSKKKNLVPNETQISIMPTTPSRQEFYISMFCSNFETDATIHKLVPWPLHLAAPQQSDATCSPWHRCRPDLPIQGTTKQSAASATTTNRRILYGGLQGQPDALTAGEESLLTQHELQGQCEPYFNHPNVQRVINKQSRGLVTRFTISKQSHDN